MAFLTKHKFHYNNQAPWDFFWRDFFIDYLNNNTTHIIVKPNTVKSFIIVYVWMPTKALWKSNDNNEISKHGVSIPTHLFVLQWKFNTYFSN